MDHSSSSDIFAFSIEQRDSDVNCYDRIVHSPDHKTITSQNKSNKKQFCYHYAQNKQFILGQGSYGKVYICYYESKQKNKIYKLALKIITIPNSIQKVKKIDEILEFTREQVKNLIKLRNNPNIIIIEDVIGDTKNNRIYIILQYCNNKDLDSFFRMLHNTKQITTEEDILRYFKQILNAFEDIRKYNIIHRDIKPENIMVNNGVLKIADFGLSKQLFQKTQAFYDQHFGTFVTASPQIRFKEKYTNKCDIYSLGATLFWMIYLEFPFKNQYSRQDFLKASIKYGNQTKESQIKVSKDLILLLKGMLAYTQEARIGWNQLFTHPIFKKVSLPDQVIRTSIGRNIAQGNFNLDIVIPKQFHLYILNNPKQYNLSTLSNHNLQQDPIIKLFMHVFLQVLNQKFKVNFLKEVLRQTYQFKLSDRIKNKTQFTIMRDLIRLGLQKYIIYLMEKIKKELQCEAICQILDAKIFNLISNTEYFNHFVKDYVVQVQNYQKSNKKPKLSEQERQALKKRCEDYQIYKSFENYIEERNILDQEYFLHDLQRCFVEVIYFVKDEVSFYRKKQKNLAQIEQKRYRQLIILIHHYYMIILINTIFPKHYKETIDYDFQKFIQQEKYTTPKDFIRLAGEINQILDSFEN